MNEQTLEGHRRRPHRRRQGPAGDGREQPHRRQALRRAGHPADARDAARLSRHDRHRAGAVRVHRRRDPLRRDDPHDAPSPACRSPQALEKAGIIPGIKVDAGAKPLALHDGELVTEGLDGLRERLAEYSKMGARFAKWRAVITIDDAKDAPSRGCYRGQRARARALRGAVPGGRHRAHRRARGADGRRAHAGALRRGHRAHAARRVRRAAHPARAAGGHDPQAQHGGAGAEVPHAGQRRRRRRRHRARLPARRAGRGRRHRVPVGRPVGGATRRRGSTRCTCATAPSCRGRWRSRSRARSRIRR